MPDLQVHFTHRQQPDHPLVPGVHRIVRSVSGSVSLAGDSPDALSLAQFHLDRRGLWLRVSSGVRGIHVNGRPVQRMALLRAGDAIYVDGEEMLVRGALSPATGLPAPDMAGDAESGALLRGVGGPYHGRSFTLQSRCLVGSDPSADIVIDDPAFALCHASVELHDGRALLRDQGSEDGSMVNGRQVRDCWLLCGDQIVFDARHRFVLEMPRPPLLAAATAAEDAIEIEALPAAAEIGQLALACPIKIARWPWLLLSALLLAGALSALLWFGAR